MNVRIKATKVQVSNLAVGEMLVMSVVVSILSTVGVTLLTDKQNKSKHGEALPVN